MMLNNTPNSSRTKMRDHSRRSVGSSPTEVQTSPSADYDLRCDVGKSQNLFETRLSSATPPNNASSPLLELDITCNPTEFQRLWDSHEKGLVFSSHIDHAPSLSACHKHFHPRGSHLALLVGDRSANKAFPNCSKTNKAKTKQSADISVKNRIIVSL